MNTSLHRKIRDLFLEACDVPAEERGTFLERACGGDKQLQQEVEEILAEDDAVAAASREGKPFLNTEGVSHGSMSSQAALPERIGQYRILRVLGEGGMGVVYEAEQEKPHRRVALKLLRSPFPSDKQRRRFEFESEVLGLLNHPGIAKIYEASLVGEGPSAQPFFAMELVQGVPLNDYASEHKLGTRARLALFAKVCAAVQHAHQRGIVHRDLKPGNILVEENGEPRILDFGIARSTETDLQWTTPATGMGQVLGTVPYMSPEQAEGDSQQLDLRSDVYALGVILYELLAGRLPYSLKDKLLHDALRVIREEEPTSLSAINRVFRGDLETIVSKSLQKDRERRYASVSDLSEDIGRFLRDEPVVARPSSPLYQLRKFTARNRVLVGGIAATFLTLVTGLAVSVVFWKQSEKNLSGFVRLGDVRRHQELQRQAEEECWPVGAGVIESIDGWLDRARALGRRLPAHEAALLQLGERREAASAEGWVFEEDVDAWQFDVLTDLVDKLGELRRGDAGKVGTIAEMEARRARSESLWARSVGQHQEEWDEAIHEVGLSDTYGWLELERMEGLVPIGVDPDSGLWEFWHVESGERPGRHPKTGELSVTEETGIVLVLIPGGTFQMGAERPGLGRPPDSPNTSSFAIVDQGPVHPVSVEPFLVSKYEMTQGQWVRLGGENLSSYRPGAKDYGDGVSLLHPLEHVTYEQAESILVRVGLILPTEEQWEYAARAGTNTAWWVGNEKDDLEGAANLADSFFHRTGAFPGQGHEPTLNDGHAIHAPVDLFPPNRFGLHQVIGNVWEWCGSIYGAYPGGEEVGDPTERLMVMRGGSWRSVPEDATSAMRARAAGDQEMNHVGVRPAMLVGR